MLDNAALDVCIGLVFIFLLYSLLATIVQELIAQFFNLRARNLVKAIRRMLQDRPAPAQRSTFVSFWEDLGTGIANYFKPLPDGSLLKAFYNYPLIKYMGQNNHNSKPSYIAPADFSETMIHLLRGDITDNQSNQLTLIQTNLKSNKISDFVIDNETLSYLKKLAIDSAGDVEKFRAKLELWYNTMMDRSTGWYKRQTQTILFVTGLLVAGFFNIDTIAIAKILIHNKEVREQVAAMAVSKVTVYGSEAGKQADDKNLQASLSKMKSDAADVQNILGLGHGTPTTDTACLSRAQLRLKALAAAKTIDPAALQSLQKQLSGCQIPDQAPKVYQRGAAFTFLGWLITALAISLGAPFWFDLLSKIVSLRSAGNPPKSDAGKDASAGGVKIKPAG